MSQQSEIYAAHCEREARGQEPEWIRGIPAREAMAGAEHISGVRKSCGSGRFEGTYRLADGRIAEHYCCFGWMDKLAVWPDRAAYDAYHRPMPRDVYFNG